MSLNLNAGYGNLQASRITAKTGGKTFYVTASTGANAQTLQNLMIPDTTGVNQVRNYSTLTLALAQTVAGRGDVILVAPDYTTAPTDTELGLAGTNGVQIQYLNSLEDSVLIAGTTNLALPATGTSAIFNVVGVVELVSIIGVVTTVVQTQACNLKISTVSNGATTDICADLNISAHAAQSRYSITGTLANALINTAKGVPVARQATPLIVQEGTINLTTSATNTGNIRWLVSYKPLQAGSRIY
jgi:hypothetical protein